MLKRRDIMKLYLYFFLFLIYLFVLTISGTCRYAKFDLKQLGITPQHRISRNYSYTSNSERSSLEDCNKATIKLTKANNFSKKKFNADEVAEIFSSNSEHNNTSSPLYDDSTATADEKEGLRITLIHLQKLLLALAAITFIFIVLYSFYFIHMLKKIYAKERITE